MKTSLLFFLFLATSIITFAQNGANVSAAHGEPGASDRLIGTWRLVSAGTFRSDGKFEPYPSLNFSLVLKSGGCQALRAVLR
jgi:hypothetical protein